MKYSNDSQYKLIAAAKSLSESLAMADLTKDTCHKINNHFMYNQFVMRKHLTALERLSSDGICSKSIKGWLKNIS